MHNPIILKIIPKLEITVEEHLTCPTSMQVVVASYNSIRELEVPYSRLIQMDKDLTIPPGVPIILT